MGRKTEKKKVLLFLGSHDKRIIMLDVIRVPLSYFITEELLPQDLVSRSLGSGVQHMPKYPSPCLCYAAHHGCRQSILQPSCCRRTHSSNREGATADRQKLENVKGCSNLFILFIHFWFKTLNTTKFNIDN